MSLRHMEDLKKIRPVILFLIENYADVFFPYKPTNSYPSPYVTMTGPQFSVAMDQQPIAANVSAPMVLDVSMDESKQPEQGSGFPFIKPNLLVMIPSLHAPNSEGNVVSEDSDSDKSQGGQLRSYSDTEWKVNVDDDIR